MLNQIPQDPKEKLDLINLAEKRFKQSTGHFRDIRDAWVRFYKIYRALKDAAEEDSDEPDTFLPYAYGIIENVVSKAIEPLFKLKPPCKPIPKKKGHQKAADNFATVARQYFSSPEYQVDYTESTKEEAIFGSAWEKDEYLQEYTEVRVWGYSLVKGAMAGIKSFLGKFIPLSGENGEFTHKARTEKTVKVPSRVGYRCEFPDIFDIHPEPGVKKVKEMHWILEEVRAVGLEDLRKQMYKDPETGKMVGCYDLTEIDKFLAEGEGKGHVLTPERKWAADGTDHGKMVRDLRESPEEEKDENETVNKLWIVNMHEPDRIVTIANGLWIIRVMKNHLQRPRLPFRLRRYSVDKAQFYGTGAIEPIEELLYELNDIHNLSMANWIRIINRMLFYDPDKIPFPDDFNPRAGGKIRVRSDVDPRSAIYDPEQQSDPSTSMLKMESNSRGLIEWTNGVSDLSPGVEGTKQSHETLGGLLEIQANFRNRFSTIQRLHLASYAEQMDSMEALFNQYQFDPMPFRQYSDDGSLAYLDLSLDDTDTEGMGFDYMMETDPSFGDDNLQRQFNVQLFDISLKYENWRAQLGGPEAEKLNLARLMRKIYNDFGWTDTSEILVSPNGVMEPGDEIEAMLSGMEVHPMPGENLIQHLVDHIITRNSPKWKEGLASGKIPPEAGMALDAHIAETHALIQQIAADPVKAAETKVAVAGRPQEGAAPAAPAGVASA